ncbi:MAG: hypothetical protein R2827_14410 [Bdellovibrionales bacterium]
MKSKYSSRAMQLELNLIVARNLTEFMGEVIGVSSAPITTAELKLQTMVQNISGDAVTRYSFNVSCLAR